MRRRDFLKATAAVATAAAGGLPARAADDDKPLLVVTADGPNSIDVETPGANRGAFQVGWNIYDRLLTYGRKLDEFGNPSYDFGNLQPELAQEWDVGDKTITLKLRRDATFLDGTPVTAADAKYSLERALGVGGVSKATVAGSSLADPQQFVVVDDHTLRLDLVRKDPWTLHALAQLLVPMYHSRLVQSHATHDDPWGLEFTKFNSAGGGAYICEKWSPDEASFVRNENWKSGPLPKVRRVVRRTVASSGTRRALIERGDVDISYDLPPKDVSELARSKDVKVAGTLIENTLQYIALNVTKPPFDNPKVRQAIAYAVPYQRIMDVAIYNRGRVMAEGPDRVTDGSWPQPTHFKTDLARAKQLLAEAGYANGFPATLAFDSSFAVTNQPLCVLLQESLGQIGIGVTLDPVQGGNWRTAVFKRELPFITIIFGGFINYPEYFFHYLYQSNPASPFNSVGYDSATMNRLIEESHFAADPAEHKAKGTAMVQLAFDDLPFIPLYQPFLDVAMRKTISGYTFWFHRELDFRQIEKA